MSEKTKSIVSWAIIIILIAGCYGAYVYLQNRQANQSTGLDEFAKCVAETGMTMYGAYWCPHCQNVKKTFGSSFQYIPYVECTEEIALCQEKNVTGYPTWIMPDGARYEGELGLERISKITSCALPQ